MANDSKKPTAPEKRGQRPPVKSPGKKAQGGQRPPAKQPKPKRMM